MDRNSIELGFAGNHGSAERFKTRFAGEAISEYSRLGLKSETDQDALDFDAMYCCAAV